MTELERLLRLLDKYIAKAGPAFAPALRTSDLKALRALLLALMESTEAT